MNTFFSHRACSILYHFVKCHPKGYYILPANVCPVVPLTIIKAGADVLFVDISLDTLQIELKDCISACQKQNVVGIVVVAAYGNYTYSFEIIEAINNIRRDLIVIEDRCLCHPFDVSNSHPATDLILFSTGYAKIIDLGYGGIGICNSLSLSEKLYYCSNDYSQLEVLYKKAYLSESLLIGYEHLNWLDTTMLDEYDSQILYEKIIAKSTIALEHKRKINEIYDYYLPNAIKLDKEYNSWRYNIIIPNSTSILKKIFEKGLFASKHYQPASSLFVKAKFTHTQYLYENIINLFNDSYINEIQAKSICKIINENYDNI